MPAQEDSQTQGTGSAPSAAEIVRALLARHKVDRRHYVTAVIEVLGLSRAAAHHRVTGTSAWTWDDLARMGEHYGDPNEMKALEGAFSGAPDATVWNQAPGNWSEW